MKKTIYIALISILVVSCSDKEVQINNLLNKAVDYSVSMKIDSAEFCYQTALRIDKNSFPIITNYVSFLINNKEYEKALSTLENLSEKDKTSEIYFSLRGQILEYTGKLDEAKTLYKQQFGQLEYFEPKNSNDLLIYTGYLMLETLAGKSDLALRKCNNLLSQNWISQNDSMILIPFRNEVEYYDGNGFLSFISIDTNEINFCIQKDKIEEIREKFHINFKSIITYDEYTKVSVNQKFRKVLEASNYTVRCE